MVFPGGLPVKERPEAIKFGPVGPVNVYDGFDGPRGDEFTQFECVAIQAPHFVESGFCVSFDGWFIFLQDFQVKTVNGLTFHFGPDQVEHLAGKPFPTAFLYQTCHDVEA